MDDKLKVFRNSECFECFLDYETELKSKEHPILKKQVIICRSCYTKVYKKAKKINEDLSIK